MELDPGGDSLSAQELKFLRRELMRNGELRELCGFNPLFGADAVPPPWVYTRFFKLLFEFEIVMLAMVKEHIVEGRKDLMRSLVKRKAA